MTKIEWTDETWNPITGCKKVSEGCANCYAEGIANRFWGDRKFTDVQFHPERLEQPSKWRKPRMVFVNSMSDLFHESVTDEQIAQIWDVMAATPQHTYQVLTKRPDRTLRWLSQCSRHVDSWAYTHNGDRPEPNGSGIIVGEQWPLPNVWLGVTVESQKTANERIPLLQQTPAATRFLSCEPLLEDIDFMIDHDGIWENLLTGEIEGHGNVSPGINWVIVGGESGPGARPCDIAWIRSIVEQCKAADVACFVKQLGSNAVTAPFRESVDTALMVKRISGKGNNPEEWPEDLRVREYPAVN